MKTKLHVFAFCLLPLMLMLTLVLTSCREKTEREKYEKKTSTLKYKAYKALSEQVFQPLFKTYNDNTPDSLMVREEAGRLLLGYFWMISGKTTFGFAEGNIVLEETDVEQFKLLAHMMIAIGMYENGWKDLAREESKNATASFETTPEGQYVRLELTMIELLVGTYCVYERDFDCARFHFAGFATLTGIQWPHKLTDGMADIESGKVQSGLKKIKAMTEDETVPKEVREVLKDAIDRVESQNGSVDSALFWPRTISLVLYDELKKAAQPGIDKFMGLMDDLKGKLGMEE